MTIRQHVWLFREKPMAEPMPFNPNVIRKHHKMYGIACCDRQ